MTIDFSSRIIDDPFSTTNTPLHDLMKDQKKTTLLGYLEYFYSIGR